ncbi:unnamed protein product, partial [Effrenium voratum]
VLRWMLSSSAETNCFHFNAMLDAHARSGKWQRALGLLEEMLSHQVQLQSVSLGCAIAACEKGLQWQRGMALLMMMSDLALESNVIVFNAAASACEKEGQWRQALRLVELLSLRGLSPDIITMSSAISACEKAGEWHTALQIFAQLEDLTIQVDTIACNAVLSACEKGGQWQQAVVILEQMLRGVSAPDIISWSSAISACERSGLWTAALELLAALQRHGLRLDTVAVSAALSVCQKASQWTRAVELFSEMQRRQVPRNTVAFNVLLAALEEPGRWQEALQLLDSMAQSSIERSAISFNSAVSVCGAARRWLETLSLLEAMQDLRIAATTITCSAALRSLAKASQGHQALQLLRQMQAEKNVEVFHTAIEACGLADDAMDALEAVAAAAVDACDEATRRRCTKRTPLACLWTLPPMWWLLPHFLHGVFSGAWGAAGAAGAGAGAAAGGGGGAAAGVLSLVTLPVPVLAAVTAALVLPGLYYLMRSDPFATPQHVPDDPEYPQPEWLQVQGQFNFAIIGKSGAGKSTFMNAFRGLRDADPGAAKTGRKETTHHPTPFTIPEELMKECPEVVRDKLRRIVLWDLPGAGTPSHPQESYIKDKGLRYMDGVVIILDTRFTEIDEMLAKAMRKFQVPLSIVRNKMDTEILNAANELDDDQGEEERCSQVTPGVLAELREDLETQAGDLRKLGCIFLISAGAVLSKRPKAWHSPLLQQFGSLKEKMMRDMFYARMGGYPRYWSRRPVDLDLRLVPVENSEWAQGLETLLRASDCGNCLVLHEAKVREVHRIEHPQLWKRFHDMKADLLTRHVGHPIEGLVDQEVLRKAELSEVDEVMNEVWAFHGTTDSMVDFVWKEGFDARLSRKGLYGKGAYFSPDACKANQYTCQEERDRPMKGDPSRLRHLLLCRVVLGEPCYPQGDLKAALRPPCRMLCEKAICDHFRTDSVVAAKGVANAGRQRHTEYVVYDGRQVYPEYLIKYTLA